MEGDTSAKAPVTRLRRRLSVESEDSGSPHPSAPSTPTKRRGRLAAKPKLDLIEENATPKITSAKNSKTIIKEKEGNTAEKNVTPSRRSTRIKSNVSEASEDKSPTPTKRITKIKSNTSLLSDSIVSNSPRALRAARRTSQAGSDNEVSTTPITKTRKTRKDSTSSTENKAESSKALRVVIEDITEKLKIDKSSDLPTENRENASPGSIKKSTRLLDKSNTKLDSSNIDEKTDKKKEKHEEIPDVTKPTITNESISVIDKKGEKKDHEALNNPTNELGSTMGTNTKKDNLTTLLASNQSTENLQRSLSRTNQLTSPSCDNIFNTDNESVKKIKNKVESPNVPSLSSPSLNKDNELADVVTATLSATERLMERSPGKSIQSTVYIEELDTDRTEDISLDKNIDDQCVPVVKHDISNEATSADLSINPVASNENDNSFDKSNKLIDIFAPKSVNASQLLNTDSCEPMDIDETLPSNISLKDRKKILSTSQDSNKINVSSHSLDEIGNENKSTLIVSQIKDMSSNENNTTKSPEKPDNSVILSKSDNLGETTEKKQTAKNKLSLIESAGTPSHEKLHILSIHTSTPVTLVNKKEKSISELETKNKDSKERKEESSDDNNSLVDDEALEDDDYESGDSQNEEERQYALENEILDKGETLSTDEDVSNDSDYEKDSFVVSSNEEDEELLSGSGDNLSMSDNELSMSKISKEKYNGRKSKERKQLSKEMYEARHGLTDSNKKTKKNNRLRLDSTNLESEEDSITMPRKKNRMRLDSSHDASMAASDVDDSVNGKKKKKKVKRSSESLCIDNENEITNICSESVLNQEDPLSEINKENEPEKNISMNKDIEKVKEEENVTLQQSNDTHDPLEATMVDEESSLSENEQIKQNYDDVLSELNENSKPKKNKHYDYDTSLNLNNKKKKPKESTIVDQLNITQTKKKITKIFDKVNDKIIDENKTNKLQVSNIEELSSDSIDFKLLFNEDSSDSQDNKKKRTSVDFIPLKETEGRTNITNNCDVNNDELETETSRASEHNTDVISITADRDAFTDCSINNSSSGGKKEKKTTPRDYFEEPSEAVIETSDATDKTPKSDKKKKKRNNEFITDNAGEAVIETDATYKIPKSDKKKKKKESEIITDNAGEAVTETTDAAVDKTPKGDKKKKKKISSVSIKDDAGEAVVETTDATVDETPNSDKRKKKNSIETITDEAEQNIDVSVTSNSSLKTKNKKKQSTIQIILESANKMMPTDDDNEMKESNVEDAEIEVVEKPKGKKKSKKHSNEALETGLTGTKNKKELLQCHVAENEKTNSTPTDNIQLKKDNKKLEASECIKDEQALKLVEETNEPIILKSKKRKRSLETQSEDNENKLEDKLTAILNKSQKGNQKKKLKLATLINDDNTTLNIEDQVLFGESSKDTSDKPHKLEKKKKKNSKVYIVEDTECHDVEENESSVISINKKRKVREDENPKQKTKGYKENILDKVHVPRLPESILSEIEDKPAKKKQKSNIISTTPFVVEEIVRKKSKPSNFLEESVYINNDFDKSYKGKIQLKKPKVLPSIPTAQVSDGGATTNFVATKFEAQSNTVTNFKNEYLYGKNIKRLGTYELYKKQRNVKLSKF